MSYKYIIYLFSIKDMVMEILSDKQLNRDELEKFIITYTSWPKLPTWGYDEIEIYKYKK